MPPSALATKPSRLSPAPLKIFAKEQEKIDRRLVVEADTVRTLLQYDCPGNIRQLQSDIQVCCASAFLSIV